MMNTVVSIDVMNITWLVNLAKKNVLVLKMEFVITVQVEHVLHIIDEIIPKIYFFILTK